MTFLDSKGPTTQLVVFSCSRTASPPAVGISIILSIKCASSFKFNILPRNLHHCLPNYQLICPWSYRPTAHYCWSYASDIVFTYPSHPGGPGLAVRVNYTVAQEPADQSKKKKSKHGMKCNDSLEGRSTQ